MYFWRKQMTSKERWNMLSKEKIKMNSVGKIGSTKEDAIRGLNSMIDCMKHFEDFSEESLKIIYKEELEKIENKYK